MFSISDFLLQNAGILDQPKLGFHQTLKDNASKAAESTDGQASKIAQGGHGQALKIDGSVDFGRRRIARAEDSHSFQTTDAEY